jgi:alkylhydroperoxidase family enzyme
MERLSQGTLKQTFFDGYKMKTLRWSLMLTWSFLSFAFADGTYSRLPDIPQPFTDPILIKEQASRAASGGAIINLQLTTGHAPKIMEGTLGLARAIRLEAETSRLLRELAIIRTAGIVGSEYELNQHYALASACKYPNEKIMALPNWKSSSAFSDQERAMLAFVDEMAQGGDVKDSTFETFSKFFTPKQIIEISVTVSSYYGNGLLTKALRIKPETDGRVTYPGKC